MKVKLIKGVKSPLGSKNFQTKRQMFSQRLRTHTLASMLPNLTTVMALCVGLSSVRYALLKQWEMVVVAIIIAALLDAMDGRLARFLGSASRFGAELDSFSDFISFGVAPALIMYLISLHHLEKIGWGIVLFFSVCMALRLARFNTRSIEGASTSQAFFTGVPAPAAALLAITPLIMYLEWHHDFFIHPLFVASFMIIVGFLMVSHVPTYSFKKVKIPHKWVRFTLLIAALLAGNLFNAPWLTLIILAFLYICTIPFSICAYYRQAKELTLPLNR